MDYAEYQRHVAARASTSFHGEMIERSDFYDALAFFISAGNRLDRVKKSLMYGRPYEEDYEPGNGIKEQPTEQEQIIIHAILGFATEGVELVEALMKFFFEGEKFDFINLQEEFGDGEWYRALGLTALGQTNAENLDQNDRKLEKRYGPVADGFTYKAANERDLTGERSILEGKA